MTNPFPVPMPGREIRLYAKKADVRCCREDHLVAKVVADKKADFEFKKVPDGEYWIAVSEELNDWSVPVVVHHRGIDCRGQTVRLILSENELQIDSACVLRQQ